MRIKKGMWVANGLNEHRDSYACLGQVRDVWTDSLGCCADIICYDRAGNRVGRVSPPEGGPTSYEPAIDISGMTVVEMPKFPLTKPLVVIGKAEPPAEFN